MKAKKIFILFFVCFASIISAQKGGARQTSLAYTDVAISDDAFSVFSNIAGTAQLNWREAAFFYSPAPFGLKELASFSLAYVEPFNFGNISLGANTYGYELLRENFFTLGYSKNFSKKIFLGATLNLYSILIKGYGTDNSFGINFGSLAYITEEIRLGFAANNINRATYGREKSQIPSSFNIGFSYAPLTQAVFSFATIKELDKDISANFGVEFYPIDFFCLRSGFSSNPQQYFFGLGVSYSYFSFDYSFSYHNDLGSTHAISFVISFSGEILRAKAIKKYLQEL